MFKITILRPQVNASLTRDMAEAFNRLYMEKLFHETQKLAMTDLSSTKGQYLEGLSLDGDTMILDGNLPNMVEHGAPSWDMKESFKNSPKAKPTKSGGWYLIIPMKHTTPYRGSESTRMPSSVYNAMRQAIKAGGKRLQAKDLPKKYSGIGAGHKSPIHQGMQKSKPKSGAGYVTFRVVSDKSAPTSWIHPAMEAKNIVQRASQMIDVKEILNLIQG